VCDTFFDVSILQGRYSSLKTTTQQDAKFQRGPLFPSTQRTLQPSLLRSLDMCYVLGIDNFVTYWFVLGEAAEGGTKMHLVGSLVG
jgi:hypothetical protein